MSINKLNQLGDTIVEVLIAMLVVALVLAGAFAASNRSQKSIQQAQEHVTALKIAEGQVEQLKGISDNSTSAIYNVAPANLYLFCIDGSSNVNQSAIEDTSSNPVAVDTPGMPQLNAPNDKLSYNNGPTPCSTNNGITNGVTYNYAIDRTTVSGKFVFTVHVRWDSINGNGHDEVTLAYKVNP